MANSSPSESLLNSERRLSGAGNDSEDMEDRKTNLKVSFVAYEVSMSK